MIIVLRVCHFIFSVPTDGIFSMQSSLGIMLYVIRGRSLATGLLMPLLRQKRILRALSKMIGSLRSVMVYTLSFGKLSNRRKLYSSCENDSWSAMVCWRKAFFFYLGGRESVTVIVIKVPILGRGFFSFVLRVAIAKLRMGVQS